MTPKSMAPEDTMNRRRVTMKRFPWMGDRVAFAVAFNAPLLNTITSGVDSLLADCGDGVKIRLF